MLYLQIVMFLENSNVKFNVERQAKVSKDIQNQTEILRIGKKCKIFYTFNKFLMYGTVL